ncbi:MAG: lycopene cyclase family protein [Enhygromyxa sp.]
MADEPELWIVGAGPAALLLADACVARGIALGLLAPDLRTPWPRNYGLWLEDAEALGVEGHHLGHRWPRVELGFAAGPRTFGRGYALLDDRRLQLDILARLDAAGVRMQTGRLLALEHDDEGVELRCEDGERLRGRLVVDASGHGSPRIAREPGPAPGHQVAWGELLPVEGPLELDAMTFMDWTSTGPEERDEGLPPTFLYAMPLAPDRLFVEETVLTARLERRPEDYFAALERRLHRRLERMGIRRAGAPIEIERCVIPMGGPLPRGDQRTLGFGGAAGMVHPATGYMLTNALRRRARVADAIAEQLRAWVGPGQPSRAIWRAIWSTEEVRAWRLYSFGMEVLAELDRAGIDEFFAGFFDLPERHWREFVSASASTPALMGTMLRYFAGARPAIRRRLTAGLLGRPGRRMARGLVGLTR